MKNRHGKPGIPGLLREGWGGRTECVPERSGGMERLMARNPDQPGPEPLAEGHAQKQNE